METVPITFYNVAKMVSDAKQLKEFERDALELNVDGNRTLDELSAAVGLLMLRYHHSAAVIAPQNTPKDKHIVSLQNAQIAKKPSQLPTTSTIMKTTVTDSMFKIVKLQNGSLGSDNDENDANVGGILAPPARRNAAFKAKRSVVSKKTTSLLMSCRNILKDFLRQHGPMDN